MIGLLMRHNGSNMWGHVTCLFNAQVLVPSKAQAKVARISGSKVNTPPGIDARVANRVQLTTGLPKWWHPSCAA